VPDIVYMQAPILGEFGIDTATPCASECSPGSDNCRDPLKDPNHILWSNPTDEPDVSCNLRQEWNTRYLGGNDANRRNTWLTYETSQLSVAVLIVTPQRAALADILTVVRVDFFIDVDGYFTVKHRMTSTSETGTEWYIMYALTVFFCLCSCFDAADWRWNLGILRPCCRRKAWSRMLEERQNHEDLFSEALNKRGASSVIDIVLSLMTMVHVSSILIMDVLPPHELAEFRRAFEENLSEVYFATLIDIMNYQTRLDAFKLVGFVVVIALFLRLCLYMALHPRLAVLADTVIMSIDDFCHFAIYFFITSLVMACLGHWAFGATMPDHASIAATMWTQFKMFTGTIDFRASTPSADVPVDLAYAAYMVIYITVVFMMLLNFLLAIVVKGYTTVQENLEKMVSEQGVVEDSIHIVRWTVREHWMRWPDSFSVWRYMIGRGCGQVNTAENLPAVTARELYENVVTQDGKRAFASEEKAQTFINAYARKVWEGGVWCMLEDREGNQLPPGETFVPEKEDIEVRIGHWQRSRTKAAGQSAKSATFSPR